MWAESPIHRDIPKIPWSISGFSREHSLKPLGKVVPHVLFSSYFLSQRRQKLLSIISSNLPFSSLVSFIIFPAIREETNPNFQSVVSAKT